MIRRGFNACVRQDRLKRLRLKPGWHNFRQSTANPRQHCDLLPSAVGLGQIDELLFSLFVRRGKLA
jgi:hypothetical protein